MFKSIIVFCAFTFALLQSTQAQAQYRCPAGSHGCTYESVWREVPQRVNRGASNVLRNPYGNGRLPEVRNTLRDCWRCGRDGLRDGVNRVTDMGIGGASSRRSRGAR